MSGQPSPTFTPDSLLADALAQMDQSFFDFPDATFDPIWARHIVEHGYLPLFTLT
jgi:hypothetical protein